MRFFRSLGLTSVGIAVIVTIVACGKQDEMPAADIPPPRTLEPAPVTQPALSSAPASAVVTPDVVQKWNGTWIGPEGTALTLVAKENSKYIVTIEDLDGVRTFEGTAGPDYITFERDGVQERIKATDGEGTGMKWLADESNCLTVKESEGFCRK